MQKPIDGPIILKVKALRKEGFTQNAIAGKLNITQGTVSRILRNSGMGGKLPKDPTLELKRQRAYLE